MHRLLASAAVALAAAPAAAAPAPPPIVAKIDAELAGQGMLSWDVARRLAWTDFTSPPPSTRGNKGAESVVGIVSAIQCDRAHLEYGVMALFNTGASWALPSTTRDAASAYSLAHEQGHFDIAEISARRFRAELELFNLPCDYADTAFTSLSQVAVMRHDSLQQRYDSATANGLRPNAQARWLAWIRAALDSLQVAGTPWATRRY